MSLEEILAAKKANDKDEVKQYHSTYNVFGVDNRKIPKALDVFVPRNASDIEVLEDQVARGFVFVTEEQEIVVE